MVYQVCADASDVFCLENFTFGSFFNELIQNSQRLLDLFGGWTEILLEN